MLPEWSLQVVTAAIQTAMQNAAEATYRRVTRGITSSLGRRQMANGLTGTGFAKGVSE